MPGIRLTTHFAAWVLDTSRRAFIAALFTIMFLRTGITFVAPALVPIAKDPYQNPFTDPFQHYLLWNWLGPFLAHQVGATTAVTLTLYYFMFSLLFSVLMVRWMFASLEDRFARVAMLIFALLPVSATSFYWIFSDSLTLCLLAAALYVPRNWFVLGVLGTALGMQHFEQAFFAAAAALFALGWTARRGMTLSYDWRWAAALLGGTIAGKILLILIFSRLGIEVNSGRWFWIESGWPQMLLQFAYSFHFTLFSAFGVGWLVVIMFLSRKSLDVLPVGVAILGCLLLMPISVDPTRVVAIVTFPLVCVCLLRNAEFLAAIPRETIGLLALLWCLIPWVFVWAGRPIVSATAYDLLTVLRYLLDFPYAPKDPRFPL